MHAGRRPRRPGVEALEERRPLSGAAGANQVLQGDVPRPRAVARLQAVIQPQDLVAGRTSTIFGITVQSGPGGDLKPKILAVMGPGGRRLPFRPGALQGDGSRQTAFVQDSRPGPLTILVTGLHGTSGPFAARVAVVGDLNGDGQVNLEDQAAFSAAYLAQPGDGFYLPSADANANGFVGQVDANALEHNITPLTRPIPLNVQLALAPQDRAKGPISQINSGGFTYKTDVTIVGKTTPGSLVFSDSGLGDYSFTGPFLPTDANGYFSIKEHLADGLTNTEFLIIDPYGQRVIRAFPIRRLSF